ncbi:MAG: hypothetical protein ACTSRI_02675 [Promethearchaeota archaeon]
MGRFYGLVPESIYGYIGIILGMLGSICWATQFVLDWFGIDEADKALYSLIVLLLLLSAIAFTFVANRTTNTRKIFKGKTPMITIAKIIFLGFILIIVLVLVFNGVSITMDVNYKQYASERAGIFTGIRQLSSITSEDVNSLHNFALGIRQIVSAMFLTVPCLIATWGGLGVLTADSISDAEGGILAIVAAFVVFIVVWIFKAIDVTLMFMSFTSFVATIAINSMKIIPIIIA